jgi:hypothetical protein
MHSNYQKIFMLPQHIISANAICVTKIEPGYELIQIHMIIPTLLVNCWSYCWWEHMQRLYLTIRVWSTKRGESSKALLFLASTKLAKTFTASYNSVSPRVFPEQRKQNLAPSLVSLFRSVSGTRCWSVARTLPTADSLAVVVYIMVIFSKPW